MNDDIIRVTAFVHGFVQGVGFRWFTRAKALELGLAGSATNMADGRVQVIAEGRPTGRCPAGVATHRRHPGPVDDVVEQRTAPRQDLKDSTSADPVGRRALPGTRPTRR